MNRPINYVTSIVVVAVRVVVLVIRPIKSTYFDNTHERSQPPKSISLDSHWLFTCNHQAFGDKATHESDWHSGSPTWLAMHGQDAPMAPMLVIHSPGCTCVYVCICVCVLCMHVCICACACT